MPTPLDIPVPRPGPGFDHAGPGLDHAVFPFLGVSMFLLVLVLAVALLALLKRSGRLDAWFASVRPSPEQAARQVLAERFARGDLSPEEFLERASVLNWTPGVDAPAPSRTRRRVGRG